MRTSRVTGEVLEDLGGRVLSPERVELDHEGWLGTHDLNERARRHADCRVLLRDLTSGVVVVDMRRDSDRDNFRYTVSLSPSLRYLYVWRGGGKWGGGVTEIAKVAFHWESGPAIFVTAPTLVLEFASATEVLRGSDWTIKRAPDAKT